MHAATGSLSSARIAETLILHGLLVRTKQLTSCPALVLQGLACVCAYATSVMSSLLTSAKARSPAL